MQSTQNLREVTLQKIIDARQLILRNEALIINQNDKGRDSDIEIWLLENYLLENSIKILYDLIIFNDFSKI